MKKILLTVIAFVSVLALTLTVNVKAAPTAIADITITSADDLKGCYYIEDNGTQEWTDEQCFKNEALRKVVYEDLVTFYNTVRVQGTVPNEAITELDGKHPKLAWSIDTNKITFTDTNMRAIIAGFRGNVNAMWKTGKTKIKSIKGIQFLTHADTVDLRKMKLVI